MQYENMVPGIFLVRPNRFIAHVQIGDQVEICHVKNTGRCKELLPAGAKVWCQHWDSPSRKTKYDMVVVQKGTYLVNMDSQAPNKAAGEWLAAGGLGPLENLKREVTHGDSRFDFYFEKEGKPCFLEVKGVTLEHEGVCAFPDAPTERGTKHLRGLTKAVEKGYGAYVLFVIQMEGVKYLRPHDETDPAFGKALREAAQKGVQVLAMDCHITPERMEIRNPVKIQL